MQELKNTARTEQEWYQLPLVKIREFLSADFNKGLSAEEAAIRLKFYGPNKLPEEKSDSYLDILLRQIRSPLVYILLVAAFLSLSLQDYADLIIILSVVVINLVVGFFQENKANATLAELKKVVKHKAAVLRNGVVLEINAEDLVVGDMVRIAAGDRVPADLRLVKALDLEVVESALTGESMPVLKQVKNIDVETPLAEQDNMVFLGTEVTAGSGYGIVVATGLATQVGRIAKMLMDTEEQVTPLQKNMQGFSRLLAWGTLLLSFVVLVVGIAKQQDFFTMLLTAVSVAVAAIPEGLLVSLTIILALGMQQILKRRGLVRNLSSAETLGATSVICMDKTGTLTEGQMKVVSLVSASEEFHHRAKTAMIVRGESLLRLLRLSVLVNEAIVENEQQQPINWNVLGNSTDRALIVAAAEAGYFRPDLEKTHKLVDFLPFNEKRKFAASLRSTPKDGDIIYVKGAAEIVLAACSRAQVGSATVPITHPSVLSLTRRLEEMTRSGLRVLAIAHKRVSKRLTHLTEAQAASELVFDGFIGLKDPVRVEAAQALQDAQAAGLRAVIITGDHKFTALSVANDLGLAISDEQVLEGKDLDHIDDERLRALVPNIRIYARVTPAHKLRIINAWQERGEVVAMTGDGVNDAPALKKADIGMSLGSGTEVAKSASDLVLLDNNFKTIVAAIEQGRFIYENIRRVIIYLLSNTFSLVILIIGTLFLGLPLPLLPAQILWSNIVTDGPPNLALTFEPGDKAVMRLPPRKAKEPLISAPMRVIILFVGLLTDVIFLLVYLKFSRLVTLEQARTAVFAAFGFSSLLYVFSLKSLHRFIWQSPIFNNPYLIAAVGLCVALQLLAIYWSPLQGLLQTVDLPLKLWWWVLCLSIIKLTAIELTKVYFRLRKVF